MDGSARDPAGLVTCKEGDHAADIVWLREPFQSLHSKSEIPTLVSLRKVRHVGLDDARRDGVHANATNAEHESEMLRQRVYRALRRGIGRQSSDGGTGRERG